MLDKSKLSRSLQSKELVIYNNKKYNFFVCNIIEGLEILEGWEYVEDALDDLSELKDLYDYHCRNEELTVYTRKYIKSLIK